MGQIILVFIPLKVSEVNIHWFRPLIFETFRFLMEQIQLEDVCTRTKRVGRETAVANMDRFFLGEGVQLALQ